MGKSITQTVIDTYADFFDRHRSLVLLFVIAATLTSAIGLTRLTFNDDFVSLFIPRSAVNADEGARIGARTDQAVLVMLQADDLFTPAALAVIENAGDRLKQVDGIASVASLYDLRSPKRVGRRRTFARVIPPPDADLERIRDAKKLAMQHPMAREQLLSKDGKETLMVLEIDSQLATTSQLRPLLNEVKRVLAETTKGTGVQATTTGVPAIRVELRDATIRDELTFNIAGPLVAIVIAFAIFRRVASVIIVLAGAATGVLWTIGLLGILGEPINPVNAVVAPLALTIGLTDSVHMLLHIRNDRAKGASRLNAAVSTIRTVGFPSALTSLTSAVGFASLGIAELEVLAKFGLCSALGVVLAFVSVMTIVPLLGGSLLGDHIQARSKGAVVPQDARTKWHTHLARFVVDHRVSVLAISILLTGWTLYMGIQVQADPRVANGLPTAGETYRAFQTVEKEFGGSLPLVATVRWTSESQPSGTQIFEAIADAHHVLDGRAITGPPLSLVSLYQSLPERDRTTASLFQYLSRIPDGQRKEVFDRDLRYATIFARCQDAGGHPVDELMTEIEAEFVQLQEKHPGFQFGVADTVLQGIRASNKIIADLIKSLMMAVPLTLGVLMLALRSVKAGLIALVPNVFPMAALAATMVAFGQSITLTGAAVFVMCFGIAVDDTIHTITAFNRNFAAGQSVRDAIVNAYRQLGDAVISTTVILVGGIGVVMLGQSYFTRMFGLMFCIGLFWAVVGDLIILPAVLACWPHKRKGPSEFVADSVGTPDVQVDS